VQAVSPRQAGESHAVPAVLPGVAGAGPSLPGESVCGAVVVVEMGSQQSLRVYFPIDRQIMAERRSTADGAVQAGGREKT